jgi:HlyD family secretion protein
MIRYRKTIAGLALAALAAGGVFYWRNAGEIAVRVAAVERDVEVRVFGIGTVEAQVLSKVGFQVGGRMASLHADQGDLVKAGALLARLDDAAQRARLNKSEAAKRQAAANLLKVQAQLKRVEATYQQKKNVNLRRQTLVVRGSV